MSQHRLKPDQRAGDPIVAAFDRLCIEQPDRPLVRSRVGVASVDEVNRLAEGLMDDLGRQLRPGVTGLALTNGPRFLAALLALLRQGCTPLLLDAQTPTTALCGVVARFGGGLVICDGEPPRRWRTLSVTGQSAVAPVELEIGGVIKLSSGSSGEPRGVVTSSAALLADDQALTRTMGIENDDRLLAMVPLSHSYGLSSLVLPALTRGVTLVVPTGSSPFSALEVADEFRATVLPTVPSFLKALVRMDRQLRWPRSVRLVISAGAPLEPHVARAFESNFSLPVHVFYGSSESGGITYDRTGTAAARGTLGTPVDGVDVQLEPTQDTVGPARVVVRSPAVAERYLPDDDADLEAGRFRSNDVAEWLDGELKLLGRLDGLLNVRGKKIHPREVEAVIGQLAGVDEALVRQRPYDEALVAIVALEPGATLARAGIIDGCRRRLAAHKVPRRVILVEEIPRTARGKVDRYAIEELLASGGRDE